MMWKMLTVLLREEIYYSLVCLELFPENRKNAAREQEEQLNYFLYRSPNPQGSKSKAEKRKHDMD